MAMNRRKLIQAATLMGGATMLSNWPVLSASSVRKSRRVVIIGGGFAGATAARYLQMWSTDIEVVMIERRPVFISCPQSNLVLSGNRTLKQLTTGYQHLSATGVNTIQAAVTAIDTELKQVRLDDGVKIDYERLIVAPGVDFIYDDLPMLTADVVNHKIPHAWKAGAQTQLLHRQLQAMPKGGLVVMTVPNAPFRCPPGPYERACQIALYLKQHNPAGKLVILDANGDIISKKALFKGAWEKYYQGLIDYYPSNAVEDIDVKSLAVESLFDSFQPDVLNVIPPQKAGKVAEMAGVINVDKRWCKVDFRTYESTQVKHVHVIGDAVASKLPKSGHIANSQAKICAAAIIALLKEEPVEAAPVFSNTCYSFVDGKKAGHVAAVFRYDPLEEDMAVMPGGGVSANATEQEGQYADAWAKNIWSDCLG